MTNEIRLTLAVVHTEDSDALQARLRRDGFEPTRIDAAGGFLRRENVVVLAPVPEAGMPIYLEALRATCRDRLAVWMPPTMDSMLAMPTEPIKVQVGGAIVFVLPVERVVQLGRLPVAGAAREGVAA
jgi:uncharacterized protein YaaQ